MGNNAYAMNEMTSNLGLFMRFWALISRTTDPLNPGLDNNIFSKY
jgi:hypothetical protein